MVSPSLRNVRQLIDTVLRSDAELEAFCMDYLPSVQRRFGSQMERTTKVNLLLAETEPEHVMAQLQDWSLHRAKRLLSAPTATPWVNPVWRVVLRRRGKALLVTLLIACCIFLFLRHEKAFIRNLRPASGLTASLELRKQFDANLTADGDPRAPPACHTHDEKLLAILVRAAALLTGSQAMTPRQQDRAALALLLSLSASAPPLSSELYALLSLAHEVVTDDPAPAYDAARRAVELCPSFAMARNLMGNAEQRRKNLEAAIVEYRQALALAPGFVSPRFNLGIVLLRTGDTQSAVAEFDEVLKRTPEHWRARLARGHAYLSLGQPGLAVTDLKEGVRLAPSAADGWLLLCDALTRMMHPVDARSACCTAKHLGSKEAAAYCKD